MERLKNFDVLKTLSDNFLSRIRIACVTDNKSINALIVDCDDDVYAIGKDFNDSSEPFLLDGMCKMDICDFSFGRGHVLAVTGEGNAFALGQNDYYQCGTGGKEYIRVPTQINFDDEKVTSIACGWDHTLALTESGSIYAWGRNHCAQCGNGTRENVKFPEKLVIGKAKSIACGAGHSMALLENGQVYGWGENGDGQLGLGRETHCERSPCHVTQLTGIKKLVCGMYHTLALSTDGRLYTFGYNDYGQLGLGHTERRHTPQKIESNAGGAFTDVAALWCREISVALKENKKFYIWGQTKNGDWTVPTEVRCDSIDNAFSLHIASVPLTYKCFVNEKNVTQGTRKESVHRVIGKISFSTKNVIGRGSSGTRVFRGLFDGKEPAAIKRIDIFDMTDREIQTLSSLSHPYLVRHYITESEDMFLYIASELAEMTFASYIERKRNGEFRGLDDIKFLEQISEGLQYLHSRNIIHCDIRPQNVFISTPMRPKGDRKAMITDFSVSNQPTFKNMSLLAAADGWIAREVLQSEENAIKPAIDVFALGCLFYYVLNDGNHPFGDRFHRQANVYDGRSDINALKNQDSLCAYHLIAAMIDDDPVKRPPIEAVLKHPMFWNSQTSLSFIGNASNRVMQEKKNFPNDSSLLDMLESRAADVTKGNWMNVITEELQNDLKNHVYDESSVRDLLRAIRNKQQHYDELPDNVKESLGQMPHGFTSHFKQKFPLLLVHTYIVLQQCKTENVFHDYYWDSFDFPSLPTL